MSLVTRARRFTRSAGPLAGASSIAFGTAIGHAVALFTLPAVTRLYSPAEVGQYTLFVSCVQIGGTAATLRYEAAIVGQPSRRAAGQLTILALLGSIVVAPLWAIAVYIGSRWNVGGTGDLPLWAVALVAPVVFLIGLYSSMRFLVLRQRNYRAIAATAVQQNLVRATAQLAFGAMGWGGVGLIVSEGLGRLAGIGALAKRAMGVLRAAASSTAASQLSSRARENVEFPAYSLPSSMADALSVSLLPMLVATAFGPEQVGYVGLAQRAITVPLVLIGQSAGDSFHAHLAFLSRTRPGEVRKYFRNTALVLSAISAAVGLVMTMAGFFAFGPLFGKEWAGAGMVVAALAPWMITQLAVSPLSRVVFVYKGQRAKLLYDALGIAIMFGSWSAAKHLGLGLAESVAMVSTGRAVSYVFYFFVLRALLPRHDTSRGLE